MSKEAETRARLKIPFEPTIFLIGFVVITLHLHNILLLAKYSLLLKIRELLEDDDWKRTFLGSLKSVPKREALVNKENGQK